MGLENTGHTLATITMFPFPWTRMSPLDIPCRPYYYLLYLGICKSAASAKRWVYWSYLIQDSLEGLGCLFHMPGFSKSPNQWFSLSYHNVVPRLKQPPPVPDCRVEMSCVSRPFCSLTSTRNISALGDTYICLELWLAPPWNPSRLHLLLLYLQIEPVTFSVGTLQLSFGWWGLIYPRYNGQFGPLSPHLWLPDM